jgi:hypothetical protein
MTDNYRGSSNQDIRYAADAAGALAQDQKLRDYVELAQSIAASNAGLGAWDTLAPQIESALARKIGPKATWVFMVALAGVGLFGIVEGSMQWKSLSREQQASLITGGGALAIELVCGIVKRGVAVAGIWDVAPIGDILRTL